MPKLKDQKKPAATNLFKYFTSDRSPPAKVVEVEAAVEIEVQVEAPVTVDVPVPPPKVAEVVAEVEAPAVSVEDLATSEPVPAEIRDEDIDESKSSEIKEKKKKRSKIKDNDNNDNSSQESLTRRSSLRPRRSKITSNFEKPVQIEDDNEDVIEVSASRKNKVNGTNKNKKAKKLKESESPTDDNSDNSEKEKPKKKRIKKITSNFKEPIEIEDEDVIEVSPRRKVNGTNKIKKAKKLKESESDDNSDKSEKEKPKKKRIRKIASNFEETIDIEDEDVIEVSPRRKNKFNGTNKNKKAKKLKESESDDNSDKSEKEKPKKKRIRKISSNEEPIKIEDEDDDVIEVSPRRKNKFNGTNKNKKAKKLKESESDDNSDKSEEEMPKKRIKRSSKITSYFEGLVEDDDDDIFEVPVISRRRKSKVATTNNKRGKKLEESESDNDSDDNSDESEKEKSKKKRKKSSKITSYFERPKSTKTKNKKAISKEMRKEERRKRKETLAFLHSGVPPEVSRAQKLVEKRRQESILQEKFHIFPKFTHTLSTQAQPIDEEFDSRTIQELLPSNFKWKSDYNNENFTVQSRPFPLKLSEKTDIQDAHLCKIQSELCCGNKLLDDYLEPVISNTSDEKDPWVDQVQIISKKDLVVDMKAYSQLEEWIKQWKRDIKDDGGLGRKVVEKRRRGDDGFTTSGSEGNDEDLMKKSVLLSGASGSGKIAAISYLASKYNFQVVEESFTNKRSGKEVLSRVEEATLSNQLNQSSNSLILFKDVDLIFEEEDEGFMGAISQLITASCRPIVMTTNLHPYTSLDQKVEKHEPLRILFELQEPHRIVNRILFSNFQTDSEDEDKTEQMRKCLNSIVRHSGHDIRKSINMTQFLCSTKDIKTESFHNIFEPFDLNFVSNFDRVKKGNNNCDIDNSTPRSKIKKLLRISTSLSLLSDVDIYSEKEERYCDKDDYSKEHLINCKNNFLNSIEYINECNSTSKDKEKLDNDKKIHKEVKGFIRGIMFENDSDINQLETAIRLHDDLSAYTETEIDYESMSYLRTIVKTSLMNSTGNEGKRNRRMPTYFNRLDTAIIDKISQTFLY